MAMIKLFFPFKLGFRGPQASISINFGQASAMENEPTL